MDVHIHWWLFVVFALAALLHGVAGMGFPLLTIGMLSGSYGLMNAVILVLVPTAVLNLMAWLSGDIKYNFIHYLKTYWPLVVVSLLGSALGSYLLLVVDSAYLMMALSVIVLWYASVSLLGKKIVLANTLHTLVGVGFVAGVIGGATNAMSSVLLMYLLSITQDKHDIIKIGNLCYFVNKLIQFVVLKEQVAALSSQVWLIIMGLTAISVVGVMLGMKVSTHLPSAKFGLLILWVLMALGVKLGWQGVQAMMSLG